jgi:glutamate synthase domain-containing protein 3
MTGGQAVILGPVGRNFGAGMSGGIAWIWDADGRSAARVNTGMVDLEDVGEGADVDGLRALIEAHVAATGSARAQAILDDWEHEVGRFVKVMPRDYKRALAELAAEAAGASESESVAA